MKRVISMLAVVGVAALIVVGGAQAGGDLSQTNDAAARQASHYVKQNFGIHYPSRYWRASCHRRGGNMWKCGVFTANGECSGSLRLRERNHGGYKASRKNIGCGE